MNDAQISRLFQCNHIKYCLMTKKLHYIIIRRHTELLPAYVFINAQMEYKTVKVLNVENFQSLLCDRKKNRNLVPFLFFWCVKKNARAFNGRNAILAWKHETNKNEIIHSHLRERELRGSCLDLV